MGIAWRGQWRCKLVIIGATHVILAAMVACHHATLEEHDDTYAMVQADAQRDRAMGGANGQQKSVTYANRSSPQVISNTSLETSETFSAKRRINRTSDFAVNSADAQSRLSILRQDAKISTTMDMLALAWDVTDHTTSGPMATSSNAEPYLVTVHGDDPPARTFPDLHANNEQHVVMMVNDDDDVRQENVRHLTNDSMTSKSSANSFQFSSLASETHCDKDKDGAKSKPRKTIYLQGLFELTNATCRRDEKAGLAERQAAELAIKDVNDRHLIPGYRLEMYFNDTMCDSGVAIDAFFHAIYRKPTMTALLGSASSEVTERLARIVSHWNVLQVSFGSTSPALSDQKNFPLFYRTVAPDSSHNSARVAFIRHFGWDSVATLHEDEKQYALAINELVTDLEKANITVKVTRSVMDLDYQEQLKKIKEFDCRIIIGSFSHPLARKIFCEAFRLGMYGADYVWLLQGDHDILWWKEATGTSCSLQDLAKATEGFFAVEALSSAVGNVTTVSCKSTSEFMQLLPEDLKKSSPHVTHIYDAVWAIALTLTKVEDRWKSAGSNKTLSDFTYEREDMAKDMADVMKDLKFIGVSGPLFFLGADRVGITAFHQNQRGRMMPVALYNPESGSLEFQCMDCEPIIWQGNEVPIARPILMLRMATIQREAFVPMTTLAVLGIIIALTFLGFNLYHRKLKYIKLSSPNLNNITVVGCLLVYIAIVLLGLDSATLLSDNHFGLVCTARAFLLSGGFSLAFGSMFAKTYRVYSIFLRSHNSIIKSKLLQDQQLIALVGGLVLIDCVIVTVWISVDPMERQLRNLTQQLSKTDRNIVYMPQREQCTSMHMAKWLGLLYAYKGLLLVVGCYMAWETRHVKIQGLNDSQYIGMSVYNVVITSVIVVALANVISVERYNLTFVLVASLIFISTTTTLCLLFVPKIHAILKNPRGDAIVAGAGVKVECNTRRFVIDERREVLTRADMQNRAYKKQLADLDRELDRIQSLFEELPIYSVEHAAYSSRLSSSEEESEPILRSKCHLMLRRMSMSASSISHMSKLHDTRIRDSNPSENKLQKMSQNNYRACICLQFTSPDSPTSSLLENRRIKSKEIETEVRTHSSQSTTHIGALGFTIAKKGVQGRTFHISKLYSVKPDKRRSLFLELQREASGHLRGSLPAIVISDSLDHFPILATSSHPVLVSPEIRAEAHSNPSVNSHDDGGSTGMKGSETSKAASTALLTTTKMDDVDSKRLQHRGSLNECTTSETLYFSARSSPLVCQHLAVSSETDDVTTITSDSGWTTAPAYCTSSSGTFEECSLSAKECFDDSNDTLIGDNQTETAAIKSSESAVVTTTVENSAEFQQQGEGLLVTKNGNRRQSVPNPIADCAKMDALDEREVTTSKTT